MGRDSRSGHERTLDGTRHEGRDSSDWWFAGVGGGGGRTLAVLGERGEEEDRQRCCQEEQCVFGALGGVFAVLRQLEAVRVRLFKVKEAEWDRHLPKYARPSAAAII